MPGPLPRATARRRDRHPVATSTLPAEGRTGPPPPFPSGRLDKAGAAVWRELWARPVAVLWERENMVRPVARYLQMLRSVDKAFAAGQESAAMMAQILALEGALGLTPMALRRLQLEIAPTVAGEAAPVRHQSTRERVTAVDLGQAVSRRDRVSTTTPPAGGVGGT